MLRSTLTVVTPTPSAALTTLARVKSELKKTDGADDAILTQKIAEASADVQTAIGYALPSEGVQETFWHEQRLLVGQGGAGYAAGLYTAGHHAESLFLRRTPVTAITSVVQDDVTLDASLYRLDGEIGELFALDSSGYPTVWCFSKSIIIVYTAGYVLPGNNGQTLPAGIEGAVVELVQDYWFSRNQDPAIKSETIPGVRQIDRWVGTVGDPDLLPQSVLARLSHYRRPRMGVA